jgi:hypothetical protein
MKLLIGIVLILMVVGLAGSTQLGSGTGKIILLGSMSKNALNMPENVLGQENISNQTSVTNQTNITNETNIINTNRWNGAIAIKSPMSPIPVANRYKNVVSPSSIQANSIAYRFTT